MAEKNTTSSSISFSIGTSSSPHQKNSQTIRKDSTSAMFVRLHFKRHAIAHANTSCHARNLVDWPLPFHLDLAEPVLPGRSVQTNGKRSKLYSLPDPPSLPRHILKDLLLFATKKSHFVFDGDYYDQMDGVAMGSILFYFISFAQKNTKAK